MYISVIKGYFMTLGLLFAVSACADTPDSPVTPSNTSIPLAEDIINNNPSDADDEDHSPALEMNALKYVGNDSRGRTCNLFVSFDADHSEVLTKVDFTTLDGHSPSASHAEFFKYSSSTGQFFDSESTFANTVLSLFSLQLKDENAVAAVNSLDQYINNGTLEQYIRIELGNDIAADEYSNALENVLDGSAELNEQMNILNSVSLISLGMAHGDHYHFPTCVGLRANSIVATEFDFDHGHDHH